MQAADLWGNDQNEGRKENTRQVKPMGQARAARAACESVSAQQRAPAGFCRSSAAADVTWLQHGALQPWALARADGETGFPDCVFVKNSARACRRCCRSSSGREPSVTAAPGTTPRRRSSGETASTSTYYTYEYAVTRSLHLHALVISACLSLLFSPRQTAVYLFIFLQETLGGANTCDVMITSLLCHHRSQAIELLGLYVELWSAERQSMRSVTLSGHVCVILT